MRADDTQRLDDSSTRLEVTGGEGSVRVVAGANEGLVCLLPRSGLLLGRGRASSPGPDGSIAEMLLDDPWVSRRHARLHQAADGGWMLTDLGSRNRAYVDGAPLGEEQTLALADGALVRIGETLLVFRLRPHGREQGSRARSAYATHATHGPARHPTPPRGGAAHLSSGWTVPPRSAAETSPPALAELPGVPGFPGCAPGARAVRRRLGQLARTSGHVLVLGETGTGKERVARALAIADRPFVPQNCAELTRELARSELFGHLRGSFSGAHAVKTGLVEVAERGVLFLDEIGELPMDVQAELLRFLEDGGYRPVGATELRRSSARVVAATNADLDAAVRAGKFRLDLLARLRASNPPLELPPLRERREDILDWAAYFFREAMQEHLSERSSDDRSSDRSGDRSNDRLEPRPRIDTWMHHRNGGTAECLLLYPWPGNLRELRGVMRGVAAAGLDLSLRPEQLPRALREHRRARRCSGDPAAPLLAPGSLPSMAPGSASVRTPVEAGDLPAPSDAGDLGAGERGRSRGIESSDSTDSLQPALPGGLAVRIQPITTISSPAPPRPANAETTSEHTPAAPLATSELADASDRLAPPRLADSSAPSPSQPASSLSQLPGASLDDAASLVAAPVAAIEPIAPFVSRLPMGQELPTESTLHRAAARPEPRAPIAPPVQPTSVTPLSAIKELSEELTRDVIEAALASTSGSIRATAIRLGIERRKLYRLCERLGIDLDYHRANPKKE